MTAVADLPASSPEPFVHTDSGALRFWVALDDGAWIGAIISRETLHHRFRADLSGDTAIATYNTHRVDIDDAVRRRVARGSIEPVMLREADLPPLQRL